MISTLYIEEAVAAHPLTQRIQQRFPQASSIPIERYGEVFNRKAQNFRLQKRRPALILARKHDGYVIPTPVGYGIGAGATRNFYMAHMLNCVYDCRYCFLQGMYRSAHYVLFVNFEDFKAAMVDKLAEAPAEDTFFFSGYDCDSLALEPVSGYVEDLLPFFEDNPRAWLELRTKSTQVRKLTQRVPLNNVVVAFSFTPSSSLEHKVPSLERRIQAMAGLARQGWPIGLRFDPLLYDADYQTRYRDLFRSIFAAIQPGCLHSVSFGPFRLPRDFFKTMRKLYPDEVLFANAFSERNGMVSYPQAIEQELRDFCLEELRAYLPASKLFPCEF